jgi:peptide methionine sulfoxide reductase MsrA
MKTIYLAGGCFWSLEEYLRRLPGVISTEVGYANGTTENPTYEDV